MKFAAVLFVLFIVCAIGSAVKERSEPHLAESLKIAGFVLFFASAIVAGISGG